MASQDYLSNLVNKETILQITQKELVKEKTLRNEENDVNTRIKEELTIENAGLTSERDEFKRSSDDYVKRFSDLSQ